MRVSWTAWLAQTAAGDIRRRRPSSAPPATMLFGGRLLGRSPSLDLLQDRGPAVSPPGDGAVAGS